MLDVQRTGTALALRGLLDAEGGRFLLRALATVDGDVRIDGSGLERIDGAGLTALVLARRQCLADGCDFELVAVAPAALQGLRAGQHLRDLLAARRETGTAAVGTGDARRSAPAPPG